MTPKTLMLAKFAKTELMPLLPKEYDQIHGNRTILRSKGCLMQWIGFATGKAGHIKVIPTFYVVGADDKEIVMTGSATVDVNNWRNWSFPPDTLLDHTFAQTIIDRIEKASPISFLKPLEDAAMISALKSFDQTHFAILSYIAYLYLCMGDASAKPYLLKLEKYYAKVCQPSNPYGVRDFEYARQARAKTLISRMNQPDCVALCRQEAETHAELLGLPKLTWPEEWPLQLSLLSEKPSIFNKLFGI